MVDFYLSGETKTGKRKTSKTKLTVKKQNKKHYYSNESFKRTIISKISAFS